MVSLKDKNKDKVIQKTLIWDKYDSEKSFKRPTAREGFSFCFLQDKNKYLLFGGISHVRYSDVYTLSTDEWKWDQQKCNGELPKELSYCASWYDAPYFYIQGGRTKEIAIQDTYILDTNTWDWYKAFTLDPIDPRFHHAAVKIPNQSEAYIFGGFGQKQNKCLNDMNKFDYKYIKLLPNDKDKVSGANWKQNLPDFGPRPSPRMGHAMMVWENSIIVYGGMGDDGKIDDDKIYQFKMDYKMWSIIAITGIKPGARVNHSMGLLKKNTLIIFGGKYIDLIEKNSMTSFVAGIGPTQRFGHQCAFNNKFSPEELVLVGGLDSIYCPMEIFVLRETEIDNEKKWIYEQKNQNSGETEEKDPIFDIAKQAIITYKNQLEALELKNLEVNKKYADLYNMLNNYKKKEMEEYATTNIKKNEMKDKMQAIDSEQKVLELQSNQLREYNNFYNQYLEIIRARILVIYEYIVDAMDAIMEMDEIVSDIDKSEYKMLLFSNVDMDSLVYKRQQFKVELESFKMFFKDVSILENELYEEIKKLEKENSDKFKDYYLIKSDERTSLNLKNPTKIIKN